MFHVIVVTVVHTLIEVPLHLAIEGSAYILEILFWHTGVHTVNLCDKAYDPILREIVTRVWIFDTLDASSRR